MATTSRPLSGAAQVSHQRKQLLDSARTTMRRRDPLAVQDVVALLRVAASLGPVPPYTPRQPAKRPWTMADLRWAQYMWGE